ncbi:FkbM family methyltransferase [uncultured Sphingomonas sp.]|uniref:FkbM family methyltransferase n=1 Tax=uncultured Sphingomonas sp. TaxID=158754 RepID=UPI0035CC3FE6
MYGAGGYGQLVARSLLGRGLAVHGIIDRRACDPGFAASLPVPAVLPDHVDAEAAVDGVLVVGIHNFAVDPAPILAWAKAKGFGEIIVPGELPDLIGPELGSYWLTAREHSTGHLDAIEQASGLVADAHSREVLTGIAGFRITADHALHPASHQASQYFPPDVPLAHEPLCLVDGGAFTGDALASVRASGRSLAQWFAFEPDLANFAALVATARDPDVGMAALFPCGLGERTAQIRFASGESAGSHAADNGDSMVQVVALDEVLPTIAPNYIKLDIEGAERSALTGMRRTLERCRPALAVSIYHRPEDLWELPLLVHQLLPEARLFVRQHGFNGFDTVLYAVH